MLTPVGLRHPSVSKTEVPDPVSLSSHYQSHIIDQCTQFHFFLLQCAAQQYILDTAAKEVRLENQSVMVVCLDSTSVKVHPDGTGALKKGENKRSEGREADLPRKFIWLPHLTERLSAFHSPAEQDTIRQKE